MLMAASWPSNNEAAVTNRNGVASALPETPGKSSAAVLIELGPPPDKVLIFRQNQENPI
jgi:hypothetical protein